MIQTAGLFKSCKVKKKEEKKKEKKKQLHKMSDHIDNRWTELLPLHQAPVQIFSSPVTA